MSDNTEPIETAETPSGETVEIVQGSEAPVQKIAKRVDVSRETSTITHGKGFGGERSDIKARLGVK